MVYGTQPLRERVERIVLRPVLTFKLAFSRTLNGANTRVSGIFLITILQAVSGS